MPGLLRERREVDARDPFGAGENRQLSRALTDGDITKQQAVFETDCWAALTELDEKAREAEEFKQKTKK